MKKIRSKLKEKSGAAMLETVIAVFIVCLVIVLVLQVATAVIFRSRLGTFATNASKIVAASGKYDNSVRAEIEEYKNDNNLGSATVSLQGTEYLTGTNKIQLNDKVKVTVTAGFKLDFFTFHNFSIPMKNKAEARSEVYWK